MPTPIRIAASEAPSRSASLGLGRAESNPVVQSEGQLGRPSAHPFVVAARVFGGPEDDRTRSTDESACLDELQEAAAVSVAAQFGVDAQRSYGHDVVAERDDATADRAVARPLARSPVGVGTGIVPQPDQIRLSLVLAPLAEDACQQPFLPALQYERLLVSTQRVGDSEMWQRREDFSPRLRVLANAGSDGRRKGETKMKLLTAVIAPDRLDGVIAALDGAGLRATTIASAQASGLQIGPRLQHRGAEYRDQRCVRLEVLVADVNAEVAVGLLARAGGPDPDALIVWISDVDRPATSKPLVGASATFSHS